MSLLSDDWLDCARPKHWSACRTTMQFKARRVINRSSFSWVWNSQRLLKFEYTRYTVLERMLHRFTRFIVKLPAVALLWPWRALRNSRTSELQVRLCLHALSRTTCCVHSLLVDKKKRAKCKERSRCLIFLRAAETPRFEPLSLVTNRCAGSRRKRVAPRAQWDGRPRTDALLRCTSPVPSLFFYALLRELVVGKQ